MSVQSSPTPAFTRADFAASSFSLHTSSNFIMSLGSPPTLDKVHNAWRSKGLYLDSLLESMEDEYHTRGFIGFTMFDEYKDCIIDLAFVSDVMRSMGSCSCGIKLNRDQSVLHLDILAKVIHTRAGWAHRKALFHLSKTFVSAAKVHLWWWETSNIHLWKLPTPTE